MRHPAIVLCAILLGMSANVVPAAANLTPTFTTIDVPGADSTEVRGINRYGLFSRFVEMVGTYHDAKGTHGFLLSGGRYTSLNVPGGTDTTALGINAWHEIVGSYTAQDGSRHGYTYRAGTYTKLDFSRCGLFIGGVVGEFDPQGIDSAGDLVGLYGGAEGFLLHNGRCTFSPFGSDLYAINTAEQAAGSVVDGNGAMHGATLFPGSSNPLETLFDIPGAFSTTATGINDQANVVGYYTTGIVIRGIRALVRAHGFIFAYGEYSAIDYPGAWQTRAFGISDGDLVGTLEIVGRYETFLGASQGFVASIPRPQIIEQSKRAHVLGKLMYVRP